MEQRPRRVFGIVSGRRASFLDWLIVLAMSFIVALFAHNAMWQRYLDRKEAQALADWNQKWARVPPEKRVRLWVPDRRFRLPFDWSIR